jgi:K+-transporting ATPase ATPase C chain
MSVIRPALTAFAALSVLTGLAYPLLVTGIAQVAMPGQANGSLIRENGVNIGSELIGQNSDDPKNFWGRLSATSPIPNNAASSSGSNLSAGNPQLREAAEKRIADLQAADPSNLALVPVDLVTASGSGLDPHISLASVEFQVRRVARLRGLSEPAVRDLVARHTEAPQLGLFGEARVNVLKLNRQLDKLSR